MPIAKIVKVWYDDTDAFVSVECVEPDAGIAQYTASVPLSALAGLTNMQKKAALLVALKAVRKKARAGINELPITGTVDLGT